MIDYHYLLIIERQAALRAEADARRLARSARVHSQARAADRPARPSRWLASLGEKLILAGRVLAPDTEECLPGH